MSDNYKKIMLRHLKSALELQSSAIDQTSSAILEGSIMEIKCLWEEFFNEKPPSDKEILSMKIKVTN